MNEVRSTSTARVHAHRPRNRLGVQRVAIELSEQQVDRLADEGYLDGDNTVAQAIERLLADHLAHRNTRVSDDWNPSLCSITTKTDQQRPATPDVAMTTSAAARGAEYKYIFFIK